MGYEKNDLRRCRSGILFTLGQLSNEGHVYAEEEQLLTTAKSLLEAEEEPIRQAMDDMIQTKDLIKEDESIYMPPFFYAENGTAKGWLNLLRRKIRRSLSSILMQFLNQQE